MTTGTSSHSASPTVRRITAMGLLVTIGIVFGDIGTSPLYVMKTIMHVYPAYDADYIIGAVSCVIWTLTLQTTLKYVIIALRADNKGEGGILALFSLVRKLPHKWLYIVAAVGASTLLADGVITPALTVTSAVEGLCDIDPRTPVVPIVLTIITLIFLAQRSGTSAIGRWFGPFMLIWFLMLGILGIMNIGADTSIFHAFNPYYAVRLIVHYPGWMFILGAVFLCTTGAEALYSDLGHCGRLNISVSWIFVKIMLILNYLGQGAWIIAHQGAIAADANPFYAIMPEGFLIAGIIMSTGAAIIASQALISGSFTLISEAINLDFWPRMHIKYPGTIKGQLYVPAINMFLFLGCLLTVVIFRSSARMEAAYGLAITVTMLTTTVLLGFYLRSRGVASWITALFMLVFIALEGAFFTANVFKFMHGGWFTVLIAGLLCAIMLAWHIGRRVRSRFIDYKPLDGYVDIITDIRNDREIAKYASNVVYISYSHTEGQVESKLLYSIINKQPKRADHYWIVRIDHVDEPDTLEYSSKTIVHDALFLINLRIGFKVRPQVSVYLRQIVEDLVADNQLNLTSTYPSMMRHSIPGDFRFVIIQRVFSQSSNCKPSERRIMAIYELLRHITITADKALGLDTSTVTVEQVPLIINNRPNHRITRIS